MWEFAGEHPVWFFTYLLILCLTVSVIASSFLSAVKFIYVDVFKGRFIEQIDKAGDGVEGGSETVESATSQQKRAVSKNGTRSFH